jgi:P27 family predicted phage terminase small subunit
MGGRRAPGGGRKRKPTILKVLEGTWRRDRANPNEPNPDPIFPWPPPAFLHRDAKDEWRRLRDKYGPLNVINELHRGVLTIYCQAWSQVKEAEKDIQGRGTFVEVDRVVQVHGQDIVVKVTIKNPYCALRKEGLETLRKAAVELGITPSAQSRVQGTPKKKPGSAAPAAAGAPATPDLEKFWKPG